MTPPRLFLAGLLAFGGLLPVAAQTVLPPQSLVGDKTIGDWTADWWRWVEESPTNSTSHLDFDGSRATNGQPWGPVFFMGSIAPNIPPPTQRTFTILEGQYLLIPLLALDAENIDVEPAWMVPELRAILDSVVTNFQSLHLSIDGDPVPNLALHRVPSPVFSFHFTNADNYYSLYYGRPITGWVEPVLADGYWVLLEPLPPGAHVLRYGVIWPKPAMFQDCDITANITVLPKPLLSPDALIGDKTVADWTVEWWKSLNPQSTNENPFFDPDGRWAHRQQPPHAPVFLVPGAVVDTNLTIRRHYAVPANQYLLFPLLVGDMETIDANYSAEELRAIVRSWFEPAPEVYFYINGVRVPILPEYYLETPLFSLDLASADNMLSYWFGRPIYGFIDPIAMNGWWIVLKPLPPGIYTFSFGGEYRFPGGPRYDRIDTVTVLANFESLSAQAGGPMRLSFKGLLGQRYVLEASTNLVNWLPLRTNTVTTMPFDFVDAQAVNFRYRFYRTRQQP